MGYQQFNNPQPDPQEQIMQETIPSTPKQEDVQPQNGGVGDFLTLMICTTIPAYLLYTYLRDTDSKKDERFAHWVSVMRQRLYSRGDSLEGIRRDWTLAGPNRMSEEKFNRIAKRAQKLGPEDDNLFREWWKQITTA